MKLKTCLCMFLQTELGTDKCFELAAQIQQKYEHSRKRLVRLNDSGVYGVVERDILYIRQAFALNESDCPL